MLVDIRDKIAVAVGPTPPTGLGSASSSRNLTKGHENAPLYEAALAAPSAPLAARSSPCLHVAPTEPAVAPTTPRSRRRLSFSGVGAKSVNPYEILRAERAEFILGRAT